MSKMKKFLAVVLAVAVMCSLFTVEMFAAEATYTVTVMSNDGTETLSTQTVDSGSKLEITSTGLNVDGYDGGYVYAGDRQFLGFSTSANATSINSFYSPGYSCEVTKNLTLYVVEADKLGAHTIVGDPIEGATSYDLYMIPDGTEIYDVPMDLKDGFKYYVVGEVSASYSDNGGSSSDRVHRAYFCIMSKEPAIDFSFSMFGYSNQISLYQVYDADCPCYFYDDSSYTSVLDIMSVLQGDDKDTLVSLGGALDNRTWSIYVDVFYTNVLKSDISLKFDDSDTLKGTQIVTVNDFESVPYATTQEEALMYNSTYPDLHIDLEAFGLSKGSYQFAVKAKGEGYYDSDFSNIVTYIQEEKFAVTPTLTNLTISNIYDDSDFSSGGHIYANRPLALRLDPADGYLQPDEIVVTMSGNTLTVGSGYHYNVNTGVLIINNVSGPVTVTAQGLLKVAAPEIEQVETTVAGAEVVLKFDEVANASGYAVYVDGEETAEFATSITDGVVLLSIREQAFSVTGTYDIYVVALPIDGYMESNPSNTIVAYATVQMTTPVIFEASDLVTEEYLYVLKADVDSRALGFDLYVEGAKCTDYTSEIDGEYEIIYIASSVFAGGDDNVFDVYIISKGPSGTSDSEASNVLTVTVAKLATPEISLQ